MWKINLQSKDTFDYSFKLTGEYNVITETSEFIIQDPDSKETFVIDRN